MADPPVFPVPGQALKAEFATWPADRLIHRVHQARFGLIQFNGSGLGNARFSPIASHRGRTVPTLYGGETFECALMETVFHDVPHAAGFKSCDKNNLVSQRVSVLSPDRDLLLVDLSAKALRKLGIARARLLESDAADYPHTRPWAAALHGQFPEADGLRWVSRQDDEAHALILFGDRVKRGALRIVQTPAGLMDDPERYLRVLTLAQVIGVDFV